MNPSMTREIAAAYAARVGDYIEAVGRIAHAAEKDKTYVLGWAEALDGRVLDVGCGPGQWTNWLREHGVDVAGVDPVQEFVERAQRDYPETTYSIGEAQSLDVEDRALSGLLAWYSLIHLSPGDMHRAFSEFARVVRPGGSVLLGFFTAGDQDRFAHAVAPAYYWPIDMLASLLERAGFTVIDAETREGRPDRAHGALIAIRRAPGSDCGGLTRSEVVE